MTDQIEIPADWQQMHWKHQTALASSLANKDVLEAAEARQIIATALRDRTQAELIAARSVPAPVVKENETTLMIRLKRDTWQGEERVQATGEAVEWPLEDAKRLIKQQVAERADPLPGE